LSSEALAKRIPFSRSLRLPKCPFSFLSNACSSQYFREVHQIMHSTNCLHLL
jgi:hypothetical protein